MEEKIYDATPVEKAEGAEIIYDATPVEEVPKPAPASAPIKETSLWGAVKTAPAGAVASLVDSAAGVADMFGSKETADRLRLGATAARQQIQLEEPVDHSSWKGAARNAATSIATQLPALVAGFFTGPLLPLLGLGAQAGTQKVSDLVAKGVSLEKALPLGALSGSVEVITEKIPFGSFLKLLKGKDGIAKNIAKMLISEQLGEGAATTADMVIDLVKPDETWNWGKYRQALKDTAKATLIQSGVMSAAGAGAGKLAKTLKEPAPTPAPTTDTANILNPSEVAGLDAKPATGGIRQRRADAKAQKAEADKAAKEVVNKTLFEVEQTQEAEKDDPVVITEEEVTAEKAEEEAEPTAIVATEGSETNVFVTNKVKELGSVEAVDKAYPRDDKVSIFARDLARKMFPVGLTSKEREDIAFNAFRALPLYQEREALYKKLEDMQKERQQSGVNIFAEDPVYDAAVKEIRAKIDSISSALFTTPESKAFGEAHAATQKEETKKELAQQKVHDDSVKDKWDSAARHGTDFDALEGILEGGLEIGSALDTTADHSWASEYPIQVILPSARLGARVEHNGYYKSANTVRAAKVIIDLGQYVEEAVPQYRETIKQLQEKYPDVTFEVIDSDTSIVETPSVQNKAQEAPLTYQELWALKRMGYNVLWDSKVPSTTELATMAPEQLEVQLKPNKKAIATKPPGEWRAILEQRKQGDDMALSEEAMAKARAVYEMANQAGAKQQARRRDRVTLLENDYTEAQIGKMTEQEIERRASIVRGEVDPLIVDEEKLTELDKEAAALDAEMEGKSPEEWTDDQLARLAKIVEQYQDPNVEPLSIELKPNIFDIVDPDTGISIVSYSQYSKWSEAIRRAVDKRERASKAGKAATKQEKRRLGKLVTQLEEEGETSEDDEAQLEADKAETREFGSDQKKWNDFLKKRGLGEDEENEGTMFHLEKGHKFLTFLQASAKARAEALALLAKETLSDSEARILRTVLYKVNHKTESSARAWLKVIKKGEEKAAQFIKKRRSAFSMKAIAEAERLGEITKEEAKYMRTIFRTLVEQPDFELQVTEEGMLGFAGFYAFTNNLIRIKAPKATAHEIMHWAFYNILTPQDRISFYEDFINNYYSEGKKNRAKIAAATSDSFNARRSSSEFFAARGSDYINDVVLTPVEKTMFQKVIAWFRDLATQLKQRNVSRDYSDVVKYFDKIVDKKTRRTWTEEGLVVEEKAPLGPLDYSGINSLAFRVRLILDTFRQAGRSLTGKQVLAELQGDDWGVPWDTTQRVMVKSKDQNVLMRFLNGIRNPFRSPYWPAEGSKAERHIFNINLAEMYTSYMYGQHSIDIRDAMEGGTGRRLNKESRVKVTTYLREVMNKKAPSVTLTQEEAESARLVRQWLDTMRGRYKLFLLGQYKKGLNKTEFKALQDLIAGASVTDLALRYKQLDVDTLTEIAQKYKEVDEWGLEDYIPNVELGRFKILVSATTSDGKPYKKLVGIGLSLRDAVRKAKKYALEHPAAKELLIDTDFNLPADDTTPITSRQYGAIVNKLTKSVSAAVDDIQEGVSKELSKKKAKGIAQTAMRGAFRVKPSHTFNPFEQEREDILQGEEDIFPVLQAYAYAMEKKMAFDPVVDEIRKAIPKMSREETNSVLSLLDDVRGKYGVMDRWADGIFHTYKGYSKLVGGLRSLEANLKLGYRPVAAGINIVSGQAHTMIKVGLPIWRDALSFLKTSEGELFIKAVEPYLGTNIIEAGTTIKSGTPAWKPLGLFQMPEPYNRKICVAANYLKAIKEGKSPKAAREAAIRANMLQQFTYNIASLPKAMRGPTGKLIMQFKPFLIKELEYMATLSAKEWIGYLAVQLALGGPRAYIMVLRTLPILAFLPWWEDVMDWAEEFMNKNAPVASRGLAAAPAYVPKLFGGEVAPQWGADISAAASFQFPSDWTDFMGVTISDLTRLTRDVIYPAFKYGEVVPEDYMKGMGVVAGARYWNYLWRYYNAEDNTLRNERGQKIYEVPDTIPFILQSLSGVENIDMNRIRTATRINARQREKRFGAKGRVAGEILRYIGAGKAAEIPESLKIKAAKYGLDLRNYKDEIRKMNLTPAQRDILGTEVFHRLSELELMVTDSDFD